MHAPCTHIQLDRNTACSRIIILSRYRHTVFPFTPLQRAEPSTCPRRLAVWATLASINNNFPHKQLLLQFTIHANPVFRCTTQTACTKIRSVVGAAVYVSESKTTSLYSLEGLIACSGLLVGIIYLFGMKEAKGHQQWNNDSIVILK